MIIAADYPLLQVFWTILIFFAWVAWIWTVIAVLSDVFRRHDLSGWGKAAWTVFVIVVPFIGVLSYLIAHSGDMAERNANLAGATQARFNGGGAAAEIATGDELLKSGAIDEREFAAIKERALV
jgi:hypothetical protein